MNNLRFYFLLIMTEILAGVTLQAGTLGYSYANVSVSGAIPNRESGSAGCNNGSYTTASAACSISNGATLQGWNSLGYSWDGIHANYNGEAWAQVDPGALHVKTSVSTTNYPYDPGMVAQKGWGSDTEFARATAVWNDGFTNKLNQSIYLTFDWRIDGGITRVGQASGAIHLEGDWGDQWYRISAPEKPAAYPAGSGTGTPEPQYNYDIDMSITLPVAAFSKIYPLFKITAWSTSCYWCQGASTPVHLSNGAAGTDFSNTARLQTFGVTDADGNALDGSAFTTDSTFGYMALAAQNGGGSAVPEPGPLGLTFGALSAGWLAIARRRQSSRQE